jgi:hypothetical protein
VVKEQHQQECSPSKKIIYAPLVVGDLGALGMRFAQNIQHQRVTFPFTK